MTRTSKKAKKVTKKANLLVDHKYDNDLSRFESHYEDQAEEIAIKRLLRGKHFKTAIDVGGGYGRMCILLKGFADNVILAEPNQQQLTQAAYFLKAYPEIQRKHVQPSDLKLSDGSVDLLIMVRLMHYLADPTAEFDEISRVLNRQGYAIIGVANYLHMLNRLRHWAKRQRMPVKPVNIDNLSNRLDITKPYVNHNPHTVIRQLEHAGLQVEATLSVSNMRSVRLKRIMPREIMLGAERALQRPLAMLYFGPSIFFLVHKSNTSP